MSTTTRSSALERLAEVGQAGATVVLGNFDGVHCGHRALIAAARQRAAGGQSPLVAVSFFPPAKVLFSGESYLTDPTEKAELLKEAGADRVVILPFDRTFAATPPERFAAALALQAPQRVVIGEDFRFGRDRAGGPATLEAAGLRVEVLELLAVGGILAKSSAIREALARADLAQAEALLGAPYRIRGSVEQGFQRGRLLGYPTLNVATAPGKMLPLGVFAVRVTTPHGRFGGMANIGPRPTFPEAPPALEAHLFDVDLDLYGAVVSVELIAWVRQQQRFDGLEALTAQLARDEAEARALLGAAAALGGR